MTDDMKKRLRVRFAPSPTGALHLGGARTALFNYLFAKQHDGAFLLRIEDTDQIRSDAAVTEAIFRSLQWLGLQWDETPVHQSSGIERHRAACDALVRQGKAYFCFCPPDLLALKRDAARETYKYDRTCLALTPKEVEERVRSGASKAVRFRIPEGQTEFMDHVRGRVEVQNREIDDFVLLRSDGHPVYQIAVVADDHAMGVTHVIRGDDHLSNTPKQILLYKALGWAVPEFAHVPMILGPDKKRLSKRHGATSVEEYRSGGILPEALVNALALLGWNPGDERELMNMPELIRSFSLGGISKNPAVFDARKLDWMNAQHIQQMDDDGLAERLRPLFEQKGWIASPPSPGAARLLSGCIRLLKPRAKRLNDFTESGRLFFEDPAAYDAPTEQKWWTEESVEIRFQTLAERLDALTAWTAEVVEDAVRKTAEQAGLSAGQLIHPVRLALTGQPHSPGLFEVMELLGKETVLRRLRKAVERIRRLTNPSRERDNA